MRLEFPWPGPQLVWRSTANYFPVEPSWISGPRIRDRGHRLVGGLIGGQLRPVFTHARLRGIHRSFVAHSFTARLPVGEGCCAPGWAPFG